MTLNASGPISLGGSTAGQSINLELGQSATAQVSLNDTNVRTLAGVASGAIVMPTDFYGKSAAVVNFTDVNVFASGPSGQSAGYRIDVNGFDYQVVNGTDTLLSQWASPTSISSNYEVLASLISGTVSFGTIGSWVATSTSPLWTRARPTPGTSIVELAMEVRAIGSTTTLVFWTVTLEAEYF